MKITLATLRVNLGLSEHAPDARSNPILGHAKGEG